MWWDIVLFLFVIFAVAGPLILVLILGITNDKDEV